MAIFGKMSRDVARLRNICLLFRRRLPMRSEITEPRNPRIAEFRNFRDVRKDRVTSGEKWEDSGIAEVYDKLFLVPRFRYAPKCRNSRILEFRNSPEIRKGRVTSDRPWKHFGRLVRYGDICQYPHFRGIPIFRNPRIPDAPGGFGRVGQRLERSGNIWQDWDATAGSVANRAPAKFRNSGIP